MSDAWIGVIGVIIGVLLTEATAWVRNKTSIKSNEKIAENSYDLEMKKIQREFDLEQLNYLLKPIVFVYMESDDLHDYFLTEDRETFGKGLYKEFCYRVNDIIEKNSNLVSLEMKKQYLVANHPDMDNSFIEDYARVANRERLIAEGQPNLQSIEDFSFDNDRKFYNIILKRLNEIEKKYN
ncbi:MAG: hypothetical protein ABS913_02440 [Desemzia incerta]|uniref:hypothetical protein n=1 Tax=Desemzia incerta TaxID=82801 RepID=UPI0033154D99